MLQNKKFRILKLKLEMLLNNEYWFFFKFILNFSSLMDVNKHLNKDILHILRWVLDTRIIHRSIFLTTLLRVFSLIVIMFDTFLPLTAFFFLNALICQSKYSDKFASNFIVQIFFRTKFIRYLLQNDGNFIIMLIMINNNESMCRWWWLRQPFVHDLKLN